MPSGKVLYTHFPYCLQKTKTGWLVLNRNYKPLGALTKDWVDYDVHPSVLRIDHRSIAAIRKAALNISGEMRADETIWFYDDSCVPWRSATNMLAYQQRLEPLIKAKLLD